MAATAVPNDGAGQAEAAAPGKQETTDPATSEPLASRFREDGREGNPDLLPRPMSNMSEIIDTPLGVPGPAINTRYGARVLFEDVPS